MVTSVGPPPKAAMTGSSVRRLYSQGGPNQTPDPRFGGDLVLPLINQNPTGDIS
jgi:hypothetical protein